MKLLIANWKMAPETPKQAAALAKATYTIAKKVKKQTQVVVCVPYVHLTTVRTSAKALPVGVQDVAPVTDVASTGSINSALAKASGAIYSIVGHSEVRARGDTNQSVKQKIDQLLTAKLIPIICVGEKERDDRGWYLSTIKDQIESALMGIPKPSLKRIVIAYEPVWAIGAQALREATPRECHEMVLFIRKLLTDLSDEKTAKAIPIVYGGSVTEENAQTFITEGGASGLLVGRVSLDAKRFTKLAERLI